MATKPSTSWTQQSASSTSWYQSGYFAILTSEDDVELTTEGGISLTIEDAGLNTTWTQDNANVYDVVLYEDSSAYDSNNVYAGGATGWTQQIATSTTWHQVGDFTFLTIEDGETEIATEAGRSITTEGLTDTTWTPDYT